MGEAVIYCKKEIYHQGAWRSSRCSRKAVKDAYCKQHHPDTVAARGKARDEKYKAEFDARKQRRRKEADAAEAKIQERIDAAVAAALAGGA